MIQKQICIPDMELAVNKPEAMPVNIANSIIRYSAILFEHVIYFPSSNAYIILPPSDSVILISMLNFYVL